MGRTRKTPSSNSRTTTNTTTTTDRQFGPNLIQNGVVFDTSFTEAPSDYNEVKKALAKERDLPASAHKSWQGIREAKRQMALSELSLESMVIESMLVHHDHPAYYQRFRNDQWTEVENEITAGVSDPKPDVAEAYLWTAYPAGTREDFEELAPTQYGYAMPTFAMESKGAGDPEQAVKQAAYDGAVMTHAALAAEGQMCKSSATLYSTTKAITVTLTPTEICVYANHAVKDQSSGKISYHHHRVEKVSYLDSEKDWNVAYSVLHNAQAFALSLADFRIKDLEKYFEEKDARLERMKIKQVKLQAEARAKAKAEMHRPPTTRMLEPKPEKPVATKTGVASTPLVNKVGKTNVQKANAEVRQTPIEQ